MKKIKRLNQLKNDNIMNVGYAFVDLYEYNTMLHNNIKAAIFKKEINRVIFDQTLSKLEKYDKLEDIIMNHYNFIKYMEGGE